MIDSIIPHEHVQVYPTLFPNRIPGWPIRDTRRGFRCGRADFSAQLQGLAAVCWARFVRVCEKSPDAVFRGEVACAGGACCQGVGQLLWLTFSGFERLKEGGFSGFFALFPVTRLPHLMDHGHDLQDIIDHLLPKLGPLDDFAFGFLQLTVKISSQTFLA